MRSIAQPVEEAPSAGASLEPLDRAECLRLLATDSVGRLAVSIDALPAILPVNYALLDGDVVLRTGAGGKYDAAVRGAVVAFEVDTIDRLDRTGWSVLVTGVASVVTDPDDRAHAADLLRDIWAPGPRDEFVRIPTVLVSGRRLGAPG